MTVFLGACFRFKRLIFIQLCTCTSHRNKFPFCVFLLYKRYTQMYLMMFLFYEQVQCFIFGRAFRETFLRRYFGGGKIDFGIRIRKCDKNTCIHKRKRVCFTNITIIESRSPGWENCIRIHFSPKMLDCEEEKLILGFASANAIHYTFISEVLPKLLYKTKYNWETVK